MFTIILCVILSKTLTFSHLTVMALYNWFPYHPFMLMWFFYECLNDAVSLVKTPWFLRG